ncbi:histidine biosynthesis trifunctional-protein [Pisolithus orientalis]|uniref:histidine biosynthesis trifunctional-protein n=1 Tax=Pisolithus orientalis TaxID=936130 RepID=UPI002224F6AD|nr:histidine biosynthesis trifunctional-protein [Pisolithus orientalis]KAI6035172.1 histidine biosynthesis trifunctional-protein [Pisolithus orientalis]
MGPPFLALLDSEPAEDSVLRALSRVTSLIVRSSQAVPDYLNRYVLVDDTSLDRDQIIATLDDGAEKAIVPLTLAKKLVAQVPDSLRNAVCGVLVKMLAVDIDLIQSISTFVGSTIYVLPTDNPSTSLIAKLAAIGASLVIPLHQLTTNATSQTQINIGDAFLSPLISDRSDGLFPTVVTSYPEGGKALGLVYSSRESVKESIVSGKGVYQSRKHGMWRKGETSGATQDVIQICTDCDSDSLEFRVVQHGAGFCHLNRPSCFGDVGGLSALERTLRARLADAPEGSYTSRLFKDPAQTNFAAQESKEEIVFEASDLIYFALTRCVAAGAGLRDIEQSLNRKALKITRRSGNAKSQWVSGVDNPPQVAPQNTVVSDSPVAGADRSICMRTVDLATTVPEERKRLLKRPVLRSDEMISKVKPIVDDVRERGDAALLRLTAKFDKVQLDAPVLLPPFYPPPLSAAGKHQMDHAVKDAIDTAYANVRKFHAAQIDGKALVVETTPGVTCSRFARPIARVGLYVPGGTAVLPSTALMLGVPAQVAGCEQIVIATPPRLDGSISPEVLYVAHLVGAHAILRAGGAQAVAALAYGTQTCPKVDKIFGPGNQWVTAAKMLVQNDTEALVSIDMPAGPSEVLVIADDDSHPAFVAADLLSQAEHGVDSQVVLVGAALSDAKLAAVEAEVDKQARALSRVDIVRESISRSLIIKTQSVQEALQFSNEYAPEHLILHLRDASTLVNRVKNAGSVFVGPYTPESCGDYASGTNHTLPTNGYARQFSGVNTQSFQKHITSQEITKEGLERLGPVVAILADCEGLQAHANAVRIRLGV